MNNKIWNYSGSLDGSVSEREIAHGKLARKAAAEGIVLLKNEQLLPLSSNMTIALLGAGADKTMKGGIGSGDVNNRENITIYQGLSKAGVNITSETYLSDYEQRYKQARESWKEIVLKAAQELENTFDAYAMNPFSLPDARKVQQEDITGASAAIYVLSRICGEGKDRRLVKGDYYISEREEEDLFFLKEQNMPVILIINAGGPIEITDLLEKSPNIKAVLNISQLGQEGGNAVADILLGKETPSGKLTTTWGKRYEDYPSAKTFGYLNGDLDHDEYAEGIFVGYRYFHHEQTAPLFPFGYGLSYTTFEVSLAEFAGSSEGVRLSCKVTNTGSTYRGKEVVQIYGLLPTAGMEKEAARLIGFAKTKVLAPGESEILTITADSKQIASFSEEMQAWIIEPGCYKIAIGEHADSLQVAGEFTVEDLVVVESCQGTEANDHGEETEPGNDCEPDNIGNIASIFDQKTREDIARTSAYTVEELIPLLYGNIGESTSNLGAAGIHVPGSAGETAQSFANLLNLSPLIMADGPAGVRLRQSYQVAPDKNEIYALGVLACLENGYLQPEKQHENAQTYYQFCTAFPVGTALAQTWNQELLTEFGQAISREMEEYGISLWLAPGMNIHRNPLCGRNFEYFSEDPYLTGMLTAAITKGVQSSPSCGVTIKHFACNNQEDHRMSVDVQISERTLREIYLRGFEIAIRKSHPIALMTSYNLINGVHAANSELLCTAIARKEWGFEGVIMTDWSTTCPDGGSISWKCAEVGNDLIMPGSAMDAESIWKAFREGRLTEEKIRCSAGRIMRMIRKLQG